MKRKQSMGRTADDDEAVANLFERV